MPESTFAERAETFYSDLMREQYEVGAGIKQELDLASIYRRYADLFAEPTVRQRLEALQQETNSPRRQTNDDTGAAPVAGRQDRAVKETRHLADFAVTSYIENAVKELTEAITNAELKAKVEWNDKEIPYQNIRSVLVRESDYERRHDLQAKQLAVMERENPHRAERINAQQELARHFGFANYQGMIEQLRGWDLGLLAQALKPLLEETEDIFEERLSFYLSEARVPRKAANTADIAYILRAPEFDTYFPADRLTRAFQRTVAGLGIPLDSTPGLHLDTEPRPLKSPRAFCAPIQIPSNVFLVIKPVGGQDDYRAFFHESGHAEHFTHVDANLPFAFRYLGEEAVTEAFAFLFEHITQNPRWLVDVLRVPMQEAERYRKFSLFSKLWMLRRYVAKLRYELVLRVDGPTGADTAYRDILGEILHLPIPPERYLEDVDDGFYVASYLRAWIFERQLGNFLLEHFDEGWYESREAGKFLKSIWSIGMRDPVDELARTHLGAKGLDPVPLIEELTDF